MELLWFLLGLILLLVGAEALVKGASGVALSVGISPLVVGLTVVACWAFALRAGTAPEEDAR